MKTKIIKSIMALILACLTMPVMGQDFMNIYFKNGDFRKFYMKNITEIAASKYDTDGVQHSDYEYQCITTINDKYIYALVDVDSITFTRIDEEQAEENFVSAMTEVFPVINECETIADVEAMIDQIKHAKGVADAWSDGQVLYVAVSEGEVISFYYNHDVDIFDNTEKSRSSPIKTIKPRLANILRPDGTPLKAVIANQQDKDQDRSSYITDYYIPLKNSLSSLGIETHYVASPEVDFFYDNCVNPNNTDHLNLYDYDIIFLVTHGNYGFLRSLNEYWLWPDNADFTDMKSHSFNTSEELVKIPSSSNNDLPNEWVEFYRTLKQWREESSYRDATDMHIQLGFNRELQNNEWFWIGHPSLTEYFFSDIAQGHFTNSNSIFFNSACQSLKGEKGNPSFSLAEKFLDRGLGLYLGYSESNCFGKMSGPQIFSCMTERGLSLESAIDSLPEWMKIENPETYIETWETEENICLSETQKNEIRNNLENAHLLYRSNPANSNMSSGIFILPPQTKKNTQEAANEEYNQKHTVTINGSVTLKKADDLRLGFILSYYDPVEHSGYVVADIVPTSFSNKIEFTAKLTELEPGKKYYYRAYTYDGRHYNYGETESFELDDNSTPTDADITKVEMTKTEYHRDDDRPNYVYFSVSARLNDLTDVQEWGLYFGNQEDNNSFAFDEVNTEQTDHFYYHLSNNANSIDFTTYEIKVSGNVGVYIKKKEKSTGTITTTYLEQTSFTLLYDTPPSLVLSNPAVTSTEITGYNNGNPNYKSIISFDYDLKGAIWIDYIDSAVSGGNWSFDNNNPKWYPEKDATGQTHWTATYSGKTDLNHTNWFVLHLRNNQTTRSNYVNISGEGTLKNAWTSDTPAFRSPRKGTNSVMSSAQMSEVVNTIRWQVPISQNVERLRPNSKECEYQGGILGTYK